MSVTKSFFGYTRSGETVERFTLTNAKGMQVSIVSFAASIQSIVVPDKNGNLVDVALGYDTAKEYELNGGCFGALVGRFANRLRNARFAIDGREYTLIPNSGANHLHGTYNHKNFPGTMDESTNSVSFSFVSPDGEEGFPGNLHVAFRYTLTEDNALLLDYTAFTDKATVINLTNHVYFNLSGHDSGDALDTVMQMDCSRYTVADEKNLLTGEIAPVAGTPFDFTAPKPLGQDNFADNAMLKNAKGYDLNMVLDHPGMDKPSAVAVSPKTGIRMEYFTTQPGTQLYAGCNIAKGGVLPGKGGAEYRDYSGFCLESQHFPCAPDFDHFDTAVLRPGEVYRHSASYRFSVE